MRGEGEEREVGRSEEALVSGQVDERHETPVRRAIDHLRWRAAAPTQVDVAEYSKNEF